MKIYYSKKKQHKLFIIYYHPIKSKSKCHIFLFFFRIFPIKERQERKPPKAHNKHSHNFSRRNRKGFEREMRKRFEF